MMYMAIAMDVWLYHLGTLLFDDVAMEAFAVDYKIKTSIDVKTQT